MGCYESLGVSMGRYESLYGPYGVLWVAMSHSMVPMGRCGSLCVTLWSLWGAVGLCGSLYGPCGALWVTMGHSMVPVGRCGSLWVTMGPYGSL